VTCTLPFCRKKLPHKKRGEAGRPRKYCSVACYRLAKRKDVQAFLERQRAA
jgi:hypothetical protein